MALTRPRTDLARPTRLAATLYAYVFCTNLILLYPLYALLFTDTGLTTAQVSSVLALWALSALVLEVPSGVWADVVSRRALLCVAPLFAAAGFACWAFVPAYWSFALGAVLWGIQGALMSGAMEALVYTELDLAGAADRYATVIGRARTFEVAAVPLAMVAAAPVFAYGGYPLVGTASIAACVVAALVALTFPEHRRPPTGTAASVPVEAAAHAGPLTDATQHAGSAAPPSPATDDPPDASGETLGYLGTLRAGLAEVRANRPVRLTVLAFPAVIAIWGALDEYVPILVRDTGVAAASVPLFVLLVWTGVTVGGLLAGAARNIAGRGMAAVLTAAGVALAAGALSRVPAGIVLIAVSFALFQIATILVEARLQHQITGPSRATVTSVANLALGVGTIVVYGLYAALATVAPHSVVFAVAMLPYLGVAMAYLRTKSTP
ncbi:MAG: MFS transporter [Micromonosporaceae bacterium]